MGFEVVTPTGKGPRSLEAGEAALSKPNQLKFRAQDLATRSIISNTDVSLLVDVGTRRIGIRKGKAGEPTTRMKLNKSKTTACFNVASALKMLGVTTDAALTAVVGRYGFEVKDDVLFIVLKPLPRAAAR